MRGGLLSQTISSRAAILKRPNTLPRCVTSCGRFWVGTLGSDDSGTNYRRWSDVRNGHTDHGVHREPPSGSVRSTRRNEGLGIPSIASLWRRSPTIRKYANIRKYKIDLRKSFQVGSAGGRVGSSGSFVFLDRAFLLAHFSIGSTGSRPLRSRFGNEAGLESTRQEDPLLGRLRELSAGSGPVTRVIGSGVGQTAKNPDRS